MAYNTEDGSQEFYIKPEYLYRIALHLKKSTSGLWDKLKNRVAFYFNTFKGCNIMNEYEQIVSLID